MMAAARWLVRALAVSALLAPAACGGFDDAPPAPGLRGAPCYFTEECTRPLVCGVPEGSPLSVCTGSQPHGAACNPALPCLYVRDEHGLPLSCLDGTCRYPSEDVAPEAVP